MLQWRHDVRYGWVVFDASIGARRCPRCGEAAYRIRRGLVGRVLEVLGSPLRRYECQSSVCLWRGHLRFSSPA